jgi:Domain of unknown function (DUF4352)
MTTPPPPGWYPYPPSPPPKKRRVWPWIVIGIPLFLIAGCGALVVIGVAASHHGSTNSTTSAGTGGSTGAAGAPGTPGVGQEVRDGKFEFVVKGVRRSMGEGMAKPRGEFVVVTMTVANIGNEPQSFFIQNQKLIDGSNRQYAADFSAASWINSGHDNESMLMDMNPGFTITTQVPFDVPVGTTASAIEVHDSAFSGGAKISL